MFERWDKRRDIIVDIPEDFDLLGRICVFGQQNFWVCGN